MTTPDLTLTLEELRKPRTAGELAHLLSAAGGRRVTRAEIEALVTRGAPTDEDGRIDLVALAAWCIGGLHERDEGKQ